MAKVMISLPEEFLKEIDEAARAEHRSRSELIREAAREYLAKPRREPRYARPIDNPRVREAVARMDRTAEHFRGKRPFLSSIVREWRDRGLSGWSGKRAHKSAPEQGEAGRE